jgi:phospho-N-acetylmuramoyl-pentapeptide-transferase
MLYNLLYPHASDWIILNLFKYITFRTVGAVLTSLIISLLLGPKFIGWLRQIQGRGQPIRENGPQGHLVTKKGTPTMGGGLILISLTISTLLWSNLTNPFIWLVLGVTIAFGLIGFADDYLKVKKYNTKGVPGRMKLLLQIAVAGIASIFIHYLLPDSLNSNIGIPFFKNIFIEIGFLFIPFVIFVMVGASNAVNLTDGLDGLAIGPTIIVALCFSLISYLVGNHVFANYLQLNFIPGSGELAIFGGALVGAGLGFLWFNAPPAMVFMGDTGSLAMGAALGTMSVITKHELVLSLIGGLFVVEAVSVMLQVAYFKMTGGKRIFLMAPLHHHFEKKGWSEPTIVIRFWIIAIILALVGLSTLKLR